MKPYYKIFTSYAFLAGLFLLVLNDFALKYQFHNVITGKISDFAGLFIFPMFWASFFPKKRLSLYIGSAIFFIFWKSPYSEFLIVLINKSTLVHYSRVVDYSDLFALSVVPLAYYYQFNFIPNIKCQYKSVRMSPIIPILIAAFSFIATSDEDIDPTPEIRLNKTYRFNKSSEELFSTMTKLDKVSAVQKIFETGNDSIPILLTYSQEACLDQEQISVTIWIDSLTNTTSLFSSVVFRSECLKNIDSITIVKDFESRVIEKIK